MASRGTRSTAPRTPRPRDSHDEGRKSCNTETPRLRRHLQAFGPQRPFGSTRRDRGRNGNSGISGARRRPGGIRAGSSPPGACCRRGPSADGSVPAPRTGGIPGRTRRRRWNIGPDQVSNRYKGGTWDTAPAAGNNRGDSRGEPGPNAPDAYGQAGGEEAPPGGNPAGRPTWPKRSSTRFHPRLIHLSPLHIIFIPAVTVQYSAPGGEAKKQVGGPQPPVRSCVDGLRTPRISYRPDGRRTLAECGP